MAQKRVSPEFTTVYIFYVAMTLVLISPILKYPSLTSQMHNIVDDKSYYDDRGVPIIFFFVIGLMATIVAYSICNALQHPEIRQSHLNMLFTVVPPVLCMGMNY